MSIVNNQSPNTKCSSSLDSGYSRDTSDVVRTEKVEFALVIIKPEAFQHAHLIQKIFKNEGYTVIRERKVHLTPEIASEFYVEEYGKTTFPEKVLNLSNGPIMVLCLSQVNIFVNLGYLLGPYNTSDAKRLQPQCLRAQFGGLTDEQNGLHGSESLKIAEREIHFFYPSIIMSPMCTNEDSALTDNCILGPQILGDESRIEYLMDSLNPTLSRGLAELCKLKPSDPLVWLADWLLSNNPYKPVMRPELQRIPT